MDKSSVSAGSGRLSENGGESDKGNSRSTIFYFGCVMAVAMVLATVAVILTKFKIVLFG